MGCCAITGLATACCCCIGTSGNTDSIKIVKGLSFILQVLSVILILIFRISNPQKWLNGVPGINDCGNAEATGLTNTQINDINDCYKDQLGYRFGTGTVIIFLIQSIFSLLGSKVGMAVTGSWWLLKYLLVPGLGFILILVPNSFFNILIDIYTGILFIFIVLQMIVLLDFGYSWNDLWVSNAIEDQRNDMLNDKAGRKWYIALTTISIIMYLWFIAAFIWMFTLTQQSTILNTVLSITFIITIILVIFSWTEWAKAGALLPSGVVATYVTWLTYCSCLSNYEYKASPPNAARQVIGYIVTAIVFIYMSTRVANPILIRQTSSSPSMDNVDDVAVATIQQEKRDKVAGGGGITGNNTAINELANINTGTQDVENGTKVTTTTPPTNSALVDDDNITISMWQVLFLNIIHLTGAMYLTVLSTKWISARSSSSSPASRDLDYWIQVSALWTMLALFAWTLIAPMILNNRNFS